MQRIIGLCHSLKPGQRLTPLSFSFELHWFVCVSVWLSDWVHSMSLSFMHVCTVAYMCVYCLWWGEQLHVEERKKAARKKLLFSSCFQFLDPINRVCLQPKRSNNILFYTHRCWWKWTENFKWVKSLPAYNSNVECNVECNNISISLLGTGVVYLFWVMLQRY